VVQHVRKRDHGRALDAVDGDAKIAAAHGRAAPQKIFQRVPIAEVGTAPAYGVIVRFNIDLAVLNLAHEVGAFEPGEFPARPKDWEADIRQ